MEIMGGPQRDVIFGIEEQDIIYGDPYGGYGESQPPNDAYESLSSGRGGNDTIDGAGAGDLLFGDAYAITGHGMGGNDKLIDGGSDGRDELYGDSFFFGQRQPSDGYDWPIGGNDYLKGGELSLGDCYVMTAGKGGNDTIIGTKQLIGDAGYLFSGEGGNDHLIGGESDDQIYGDAWEMHPVSVGGNDRLVGDAGADELFGEAKLVYGHEVDCGNDRLWGGSDHDILYGDGEQLYGFVTCGNDVIYAGSGGDTVYGDGRWFHGCCVPDLGNDRLFGGSGNDTLFGDVAFFGGSPYGGFATVEEGIPDGGNDRLYGGSGDDVLVGGPGSDLIYGGTGNDTAAFLGDDDDFNVAYLASKTIVTNIATGDVDKLIGVEQLAFGGDALALLS